MPPDGNSHGCPKCGIPINSSKLNGHCPDHQVKCYRHNPPWVHMDDEPCEACITAAKGIAAREKRNKKKKDKKDEKNKRDPFFDQTNKCNNDRKGRGKA